MSIRARVGRHTRDGGRHCQNWADDQQVIIDLLNRIPAANGGTGGRLHPRIIDGIASDELYNAIVVFENTHFPGQRSGFVEPDGKMYDKLWKLAFATAARKEYDKLLTRTVAAITRPRPVAPPVAPPAPPPPPPVPHKRRVTSGETALLRFVFRGTLPYGMLEVSANLGDLGGADNSITLGQTPWFSTQVWCPDFSAPTVSKSNRGIFIHEFVHVWQYYHGITKLSAIWLGVRHLGDYEKAYPYDLSDHDDLISFNIEQQAAIIEDWWRITESLLPRHNTGADRSLTTYARFVEQLRNAGPPNTPSDLAMLRHPPGSTNPFGLWRH